MNRTTLGVIAILALAFAAVTGLAVRQGLFDRPAQPALIGGPFQLVDQTGKPADEHRLDGKWSAVFFGYTFCPEACPTTMFALGQAEKQLGDQAKAFQTVFISVDPARDTPAKIAAFLGNEAFPRAVIGLTGSADQVKAAAHAYKVYYAKADETANYTVNHSTITYLMSPKGRFVCVIPYGATPDQMTQKITTAMKAGPNAQSC